MPLPRFLPAIGLRGRVHIICVDKRSPTDAHGPIGEFDGRSFCGCSSGGCYWTNWEEYATVDDLCRRCLKAWLRACREESDPGALRELKALLGGIED